jgi:hypothetical protein
MTARPAPPRRSRVSATKYDVPRRWGLQFEQGARAAQNTGLPDPLPEPPPIPYEYLHRLGAQIHDTATTLVPPAQVQMLFELRSALSEEDDPIVVDDIRNLLRALRRRADLNWMTASEIDTILGEGVAISPPPVSAESEDGPTGGSQPADTPAATATGRSALPQDAPTATTPETEQQVEPAAESVTAGLPAKMVPDRPKSATTERSETSSETDADRTSATDNSGSVHTTEPGSGARDNVESSPESVEPEPPTGLGPPTDLKSAAAEASFFQRLDRRTKIVLGVVALLVVLAIVVVTAVVATQSPTNSGIASSTTSPPGTTPLSTGTTPTPTPTSTTTPVSAAESQLLASVPGDAGCKPLGGPPADSPRAVAGVYCNPGAQFDSLDYWLYRDQASLDQFFQEWTQQHSLVSCPGRGPSPQDWREGKVICYGSTASGQGGVWMMWTIEPQLVVGFSSAPLGAQSWDQLYQWWAAHYQ